MFRWTRIRILEEMLWALSSVAWQDKPLGDVISDVRTISTAFRHMLSRKEQESAAGCEIYCSVAPLLPERGFRVGTVRRVDLETFLTDFGDYSLSGGRAQNAILSFRVLSTPLMVTSRSWRGEAYDMCTISRIHYGSSVRTLNRRPRRVIPDHTVDVHNMANCQLLAGESKLAPSHRPPEVIAALSLRARYFHSIRARGRSGNGRGPTRGPPGLQPRGLIEDLWVVATGDRVPPS